MPLHPDLLTDEDLATRHEPKKRWFNQFVCLVEGGVRCGGCGKDNADNIGEVFISCCPPTFDAFDEAVADAKETVELSFIYEGIETVDYMGTFEL